MIKSFSLIALLCLLSPQLFAQGGLPGDLSEFYSYGDNYFVEVVVAPSLVVGKGRGIFIARLTYDLLTFRRNIGAGVGGVYSATPSIFVEAMNADGVVVDRATWRDTVEVNDFAATNAKDSLVPAVIELSLRPGTYTITYSFDDGTPGSGFAQTTASFRMPDFRSSRPVAGTPIFLGERSGDTLLPEAIDGNASFGRPIHAWVPIGGGDPVSVRYELLRAAVPGKRDYVAVQSGSGSIAHGVRLGQSFQVGSNLAFPLEQATGDSTIVYSGAFVDIPTDDIPMGDYLLAVTIDGSGSTSTDTLRFQYRWVDIPFSLAQVDYAIRALYPVADDETIDRLMDGGKQKRERLNAFWSQRDPTPTTVWNEAMAEYYRRVDYAYFNFKSIGQVDGVFTDRGKIYILNGPPTEVTRELQPESPPREIWIYRNAVARSFVFQDDARAGDYRLVAYHDLDPSEGR